MSHHGITRRSFIAATILPLFASNMFADTLQGASPARHGRRSREVWLGAISLAGARVGRADGDIQVVFFIDLNCPACVQLWQWFDMPERRDWAALWVPVSYMNRTSAGKGVELLRASSPRNALAQNYGEQFDRSARSGGLSPASNPTPAELSAIRANTHFWRTSLFEVTPMTLYRRRDGTYWQLLGQLPEPQMSDLFDVLAPATLSVFSESG